jgi:hypothetical protein
MGEYKQMSAMERSIYLQLQLQCKAGYDNGIVEYRNWGQMGSEMGCDRATCAKVVRKFAELSHVEVDENTEAGIRIHLPNYVSWQQHTTKTVAAKYAKNRRKIAPSDRQPNHTIEPNHTILSVAEIDDQRKPDKKPPKKANPEHQEVIAYWCERYDAVYQIPYKVSGARDGAAVKALLQRWKPKPGDNSHRAADNVIALINEYFEMREEFYVKDRTLARLRRFDNEIAQSLITRKGVTDIKDTF